MVKLSTQLQRVFALLKKTQPIADPIDVAWWGPYFIPRRGQWHPSYFTLYRRVLYARLLIPPGGYVLSWNVGSSLVKFESEAMAGDYYNNDYLWKKASNQIEHRLKAALKNNPQYNRLVKKKLPVACRTGKIRRDLVWPRNAKRPVSFRQMRLLEKAFNEAKKCPPLQRMTLKQYLKAAAIAYDAGFKELRPFSPLQKYQKKADKRHGGLLDLHLHDADAFDKWFRSRAWEGCHPWEIVYGHPHGIMLSPRYHEEIRRWSYWLWVDSLGWYVTAAKMAIALARHKIPFEFQNQNAFLDTLYGRDEVEVGPGLYEVKYDELKKERPDSIAHIQWDLIPQLSLVTRDQFKRDRKAEKMS